MTLIDTKKLRELADAATPGPWAGNVVRVEKDADGEARGAGVIRGVTGSIVFMTAGGQMSVADATYIAAIDPPTLLALLDEVDRAREERQERFFRVQREAGASEADIENLRKIMVSIEETGVLYQPLVKMEGRDG